MENRGKHDILKMRLIPETIIALIISVLAFFIVNATAKNSNTVVQFGSNQSPTHGVLNLPLLVRVIIKLNLEVTKIKLIVL
jgi:hypothetical protein